MNSKNKQKDATSLSPNSKGTETNKILSIWVTAAEVAGLDGMPTTERRTRDNLAKLAGDGSLLKRRRKGTKATEYNASILPVITLNKLLNKNPKLTNTSEEPLMIDNQSEMVNEKHRQEWLALFDRMTNEERELILNKAARNGINSIIPNELTQRAKAVAELILSLNDDDQREILLLIEGKKLGSLLNNKSTRKTA